MRGETMSYPLSGLVLAVRCGYLAESLTLLQLAHGFHHFGVFLTENMPHFNS